MTAPDDPVAELQARGLYVEAAQLAAANGHLRRAITLLERVFRFADAVPLALGLGDPALAVRLALDARDPVLAMRVAAEIPEDARAQLLQTADVLAARGMLLDAASVAERGGDLARTAALLERAGAWPAAAAALERAGRFREAGSLLERQLKLTPTGSDLWAATHVQLGRLLARLGRHLDAARSLQAAVPIAATAGPALRLLCGQLLALGLPHAADDAAARARAVMPDLPDRPEDIAALDALPQLGAAPEAPARFFNLRLLGAGALGRVYAADDRLLGRKVALKVLAVGGGTEPERASLQRFVREAEATRRLRHPQIVSLLELDEAAGVMVLEYLSGGTLASALRAQRRLSPATVRRLALDLLAGLSAAHQAGVVHRDVKPDNVFFDAAGNAKLADFGAAHLLDFGQTQTGGFIGTLAYLSPEQITGAAIDFSADLYGLGVTLFQALTGRLPFEGPDFVAQHLGAEAPRPSTLRSRLTAAHDETLARALAKAPSDRYASAARMAESVAAWPEVDEGVDDDDTVENPLAAPADTAPLAAALELGVTRRGRLLETRDPRVGRAVLIEELNAPLDDEGLAALARVAAVGGPFVQRLLAISEDRRRITFEQIEGELIAVGALSREESHSLHDVWPALTAAGQPPSEDTRIVRTRGGLVVLVSPAVQPAAP